MSNLNAKKPSAGTNFTELSATSLYWLLVESANLCLNAPKYVHGWAIFGPNGREKRGEGNEREVRGCTKFVNRK